MTIWRMRVSCWLPKATNTHRVCNTHCFSTTIMIARRRINVTLHVHCLSCFYYYFLLLSYFFLPISLFLRTWPYTRKGWELLQQSLMVTCVSSSGDHDNLRLCIVSLPNDPDLQWDSIADITVISRHKRHDSKFNTAVINGRIITSRNDTINLIFLYTKTFSLSGSPFLSIWSVYMRSQSIVQSTDRRILYCCTVSAFGNRLAFYQLAAPWS
jgi:hypothetical protein